MTRRAPCEHRRNCVADITHYLRMGESTVPEQSTNRKMTSVLNSRVTDVDVWRRSTVGVGERTSDDTGTRTSPEVAESRYSYPSNHQLATTRTAKRQGMNIYDANQFDVCKVHPFICTRCCTLVEDHCWSQLKAGGKLSLKTYGMIEIHRRLRDLLDYV